jgi:nitrogen regulatory protein P-II 1
MTTVVAIIRPKQLDAVTAALAELSVQGMTISEVRGHGRQKGHTETYRGREYDISFVPKLKLEIVLPDERVDAVVDAIIKNAATGQIGDGKIFLYPTLDAIRIRNQDRGDIVL